MTLLRIFLDALGLLTLWLSTFVILWFIFAVFA